LGPKGLNPTIILYYVMLCYFMLCYVILCYVMLYYIICYIMLCYVVILCYIMLCCYVMLYYIMLCYIMLCYVMLIILYYVILCYVILCYVNYIILYYVILCYIMLCCYVMLYYILLYYVMLYYVMLIILYYVILCYVNYIILYYVILCYIMLYYVMLLCYVILYSVHTGQLQYLYRAIKSKRLRWAGRVARMREKRKACWGLVTKDHFGALGVVGRVILQRTVKTYGGNMWSGFWGQTAGFCERGNEPNYYFTVLYTLAATFDEFTELLCGQQNIFVGLANEYGVLRAKDAFRIYKMANGA